MDLTLLLPEFILAGLGLILIGVDLFARQSKRPVVIVGVLGTIAAFVAVVANYGQAPTDLWGAQLRHDPFASFFKIIFLIILGLLFLSSGEYLRKQRIRTGEFYVLITLATLGGFLMAGSFDLITIYLGLELLSISSYVLAGLLKRQKRSHEASIKFFLTGSISSAIMLFGVSLLYGAAGTTNLQGIAEAIPTLVGGEIALLAAAGLFLLIGLGVKIAAFPLHMWAPDVYDGAPTPVSAFLITASEAAGFAVLLRVLFVGLPHLADEWQIILAVVALVTMTFGNIAAIVQKRVKRMLAYSAIAQAGYVLVGIAVASPAGASALMFYILVYALMTVGAFAVVIFLSNHIPSDEIKDYVGLAQRSPSVALAMTILLLSLAGIPATAGFFGKFLLFRAAVDAGLVWLGAAVALNSVISVPYYFSIIRNMYLRETEPRPRLSPGVPIAIVLILAVAGSVVFGIFPEPLVQIVAGIHVGP